MAEITETIDIWSIITHAYLYFLNHLINTTDLK